MYCYNKEMMDIFDLRREFSLKTLDENDVDVNPFNQFEKWLKDSIEAQVMEPNAMSLSTVSEDCKPTSRIVLLKKNSSNGFIFFTNYESQKAIQIDKNPNVSLTFIWHELERQVRIEGIAAKISNKESDSYFESRPEKSKLGAWASPQSQIIPDRQYLEKLILDFEYKFEGREILRPDNWGGYIVVASAFEFWQGRNSRLHDRIKYLKDDDKWNVVRLAP